MPIVIYSEEKGSRWKRSLCFGKWELPRQVRALDAWLKRNRKKMKSGHYIADIGFMVRKGAGGGGAAISPEMMRKMADLGMSLFLSEYRR